MVQAFTAAADIVGKFFNTRALWYVNFLIYKFPYRGFPVIIVALAQYQRWSHGNSTRRSSPPQTRSPRARGHRASPQAPPPRLCPLWNKRHRAVRLVLLRRACPRRRNSPWPRRLWAPSPRPLASDRRLQVKTNKSPLLKCAKGVMSLNSCDVAYCYVALFTHISKGAHSQAQSHTCTLTRSRTHTHTRTSTLIYLQVYSHNRLGACAFSFCGWIFSLKKNYYFSLRRGPLAVQVAQGAAAHHQVR